LGGQADLVAEAGDDPLATPAQLGRELTDRDATVRRAEPSPRPRDLGRRARVGEAGSEHVVEESEAGAPIRGAGEALDEERAEDLLERHGPVRELVERGAEERARREGVEVDLHPERAAGVLGRHLPVVQSADERGATLAVDQPVLLEREDDDDIGAWTLALANGLRRLHLEAVVARHAPCERRFRSTPNLHGTRTLYEVGRRFGERGDGTDTDVLGLEERKPLGEGARPEDRGELARERLLVGVELALRQLRPAE
jgi:hypothetical protein